MSELLVAPTEPPILRALGTVSLLTERHGVDYLWPTPHGLAGVQRKEYKDLFASVTDGRLAREVDQMCRLSCAALVVEGQIPWTRDGLLADRRWTRKQYRGLLWSVQQKGVWVMTSSDHADTAEVIEGFAEWTCKERHTALEGRGGAPRDVWGKRSPKAIKLWVLQAIPQVGPQLAERIVDHFGGVPLKMTCTAEELMEVPGIGRKKAEGLIRALS